MDDTFRNFYKNFYLRTGGFIPSNPINQVIFPGDFFQIIHGEVVVLGNIFRHSIISKDDCLFDAGIKLNANQWTFNNGVTKPYSGRGTGISTIEGNFEFSKEILSLREKGSFYFKGNNPESVRIANWDEISDQLILKMTTTYYSFRELYIATECASLSDWTLVISGTENAEIELATDIETLGLADIFGDHNTKIIQSKDIFFYHRELKRKPLFFKAKKLIVQKEKLNNIITEFISQREKGDEVLNGLYGSDLEVDFQSLPDSGRFPLLDMLPLNTLNANTALNYFGWESMNLDDLEKYFVYRSE